MCTIQQSVTVSRLVFKCSLHGKSLAFYSPWHIWLGIFSQTIGLFRFQTIDYCHHRIKMGTIKFPGYLTFSPFCVAYQIYFLLLACLQLPELSEFRVGLMHIQLLHTSASLAINENWDPDVRDDMEMMLNRIVPEDVPFRHSCEGPDDMVNRLLSSFKSARKYQTNCKWGSICGEHVSNTIIVIEQHGFCYA